MNKISQKMYEALTLKYRSEMAEAEATLLIYFNNPVGIGEHPQHLEEMDKFVEKITNAKDKLEMLETIYKYNVKRDEKFEITEDMLKILNEQKGEEDGN
jgi:5'-deoxynucleotidase YfbR-like HD superfamily hydrolase